MIDAFIDSWAPLHDSYLAGAAIAALLSLTGIYIVARDRIFMGAAVAQSSALGIAIGMRLEAAAWVGWMDADSRHIAFAVICSIAASLLMSARGSDAGRSRDAVTAWVFLVATSVTLLLVADSTDGPAAARRILAGTAIVARPAEVAMFVAACLLSLWVVARRRDELLLLASDAYMARAMGLPVATWDRLLAVWLGTIVALSVHVAGIAYTFGCLVLPALAAKNVCREMRQIVPTAPALGVATALLGSFIATEHGYPPAQTATALLCAIVALSALVGRLLHVR